MIDFDLLRPELSLLFGVVLLVLLVGIYGLARRKRELAMLVKVERRSVFLPGFSRTRPLVRLALAGIGLFFLVFGALGPVRGYTMHKVSKRGIDLVVCLDTSRSMLARDLRPSRLERARREVRGLLERMRGDRIALVAFSGDTREIAPLTHDRHTLAALLEHARPEDNRLGGTNLAAAISHGLSLFDGRSGAHEAIVLLTDGEDLEGQAREVALSAKEQGIRVFVVGIGTEAGGKIPVVDRRGRESFLRGPDGEEVVTQLAGESLEQLARLTGGDYLSTENSATPLEDLYRARMSAIDGRDLDQGLRRVPHDRFQWSLALGLLCMLCETGLRERNLRRSPA